MKFGIRYEDFYHGPDNERTPADPWFEYTNIEEAERECCRIVDESLRLMYMPGMSHQELFKHYRGFADNPVIVCSEPYEIMFSALSYARSRCAEIAVRFRKKRKPKSKKIFKPIKLKEEELNAIRNRLGDTSIR